MTKGIFYEQKYKIFVLEIDVFNFIEVKYYFFSNVKCLLLTFLFLIKVILVYH